MKRQIAAVTACLFALFVALPLHAQTVATGTVEAIQAGFGNSVAVGEAGVFVGESGNTATEGFVYLFKKENGEWMEAARLAAPDASPADRFGQALSVHGNSLLVSATAGDGAAYVFQTDETGEWSAVATLVPAEIADGDAFGSAVSLGDGMALISANSADSATGAVYVFTQDDMGRWLESARLQPEDAAKGERFGSRVLISGHEAIVSSTGTDSTTGAVYIFKHDPDAGTWEQEARLVGSGAEEGARFGSALAVHGNHLYVGGLGFQQFVGAVWQYTRNEESGEWSADGMLVPFDAEPRRFFGVDVAATDNEVWVGALGVSSFTGSVYRFLRDTETGEWTHSKKMSAPDLQRGDLFAQTLAMHGNVAVAGVTGDDYGAGTARIFERDAESGQWTAAGTVLSELEGMEPVTGGEVNCEEGSAAGFECEGIDLVSFLPVESIGGTRGVRTNDVWGWTDPETGREYALVGRLDGTSFIDMTDPYNPVYLGNLPKTEESPGSTWRDIKTYANHAFIVADGAGAHGMQVFDLTKLRDVENPPVTFTEDAHYDRIHSAHNIVINTQTGFAFAVGSSAGGETCGGGLHMINIQDPLNPTFAGCFADPSTGRASTGYSHDAQCVTYQGPDSDYVGKEICFGSNETALSIADVTDKENPVAVSTASYPNVGYTHQGWLSEDHRYFFMDDELDEIQGTVENTRTLIWDVTDLDDPQLILEYFADSKSSDHNLYIRGNLMYQSNYRSGLRIVDVADVENPREVGYFDTVPYGEDTPGFGGSWSNYPYFESDVIVVTSGSEGVFFLKKADEGI